jgi:hypothetical protein
MTTNLSETGLADAAALVETARNLPSGRSVTLRTGPGQEEIEVRSPDGDVEVRITLTAQGPVVQLRAARLELQAAEEVRVECDRFAVHAREGTEIKTGGDMQIAADGDLRIRTEQDTHVNGRMIYLNC